MKHNWTYKKLGEIGQVITGSTPATKDERNYSSSDICFYKPSDLSAEKFTELKSSEFSISNYAYEHSRMLPKDSILTTCIGIIGKVGILTKEATCNQQINAIIPNQDIILPRFLGYAIISQKQVLTEKANAPVVPLLNKSQFSAVSIPVPSLSEQQAIVRELDGINHLIDVQEEQLREYDRLAQSLFYTTFGDPATNPKGWEVKKLGDYFHIGSSKRVFQSEWKSKGVPFYRAREVVKLAKDGFVDNDLFIDEELYAEYASKYGVPATGDILVTGVGTLGITYIVKENDRFYYKDGNIICLHKNSDIESLFIDFLFKTPYLRAQIENCSGATVGTYTIDRAKKTEIIVPPLALQQTFAAQIEAIEQQKALIRCSLDETRTLLAARMQYYFE